MIAVPVITTERLTLRAPRLADFEPCAAYFVSERAELERGRQDRRGAWLEFAAVAGQWVLRGYGGFSLEERATGAYLGEAGIFHEADYPEPELGWMVVAEAEGKGIAFEAALAVRAWAYETLGLETLVSYIHPANTRSIRLAERLGAVRDDAARPASAGDLVYRHPAPEALQ
ncbi:MAG TPA: GNAT family N-acetyltransferase [Thermohalobaculum sp.]|nr:GNAT family N-acetyltransferase [Thermohalobaculum sp.]